MKKYILKPAKWLGLLLLSLVIMLSLIFLLIQTDPAKERLARMISKKLSGKDLRIEIQGLDGFIPFRLSVDRLVLFDPEGEFFNARDIHLAWHPLSLIDGPLHIAEISSSFIGMDRFPQTAAEAEDAPKKGIALPPWPLPVPETIVEKLEVKSIHLAQPIIGEPADFTMKGSLKTFGPDVESELTLKRTDRPGTLLDMNLNIRGEEPVLDLRLLLNEPEEGLLHALLGLKGKGPLKAGLAGRGPLTQWPGRLSVDVEKLGALETDIVLTAGERLGLKSDGRMEFREGVLPDALSPLFKDNTSTFHLNLDLGPAGKPFPERLDFNTPWVRGRLESTLHEDEPLTGRYSLSFPDLSLLQGLIKADTAGSLQVEGGFSGPLDRPRTDMKVILNHPRFGEYRAASLVLDLKLAGLEDWSPSRPHLTAEIKGRIDGLRQGEKGDILPADPFEWGLSAVLDKQEDWRIDRFLLTAEDLRLAFSGRIDAPLSGLKGILEADLSNPGDLVPSLPHDIQGRLHLEADLQGDLKTPRLSADVKGYAEKVSGLHPDLDRLLGPRTTYRGRFRLNGRNHLDLTELNIRTGWASLSGRAGINLVTKDISGSAELSLTRLGQMKELIGVELEGSLDLEAGFSGPISGPAIQARAVSGPLVLKQRRFEQVRLSARVRHPATAPEGDFTIDLTMNGMDFASSGGFLLKDEWLNLSGLVLKGAGADLRGQMNIGFRGPVLIGVINARDLDLSALSSALGYSMAGRVDLSARFRKGTKGQEIAIDLKGERISSEFGDAGTLSFKGELHDVFSDPSAELTADIRNVSRENLKLKNLFIKTEGRTAKGSFQLNAGGELAGRPLALKTRGGIERGEGHFLLRLEDFRGDYAQNGFELSGPLLFRKTGREYELSRTELGLGRGTLTAAGRSTAGDIRAEIGLESLPLAVLSAFGLPEFSGSIDGGLNLSGRPEQPAAAFKLLVQDIRPRIASMTHLPPARVEMKGNYARGELRASLKATGLADMEIEGDLTVPALIKLGPTDPQFEPGGNLKGKITAQLGLAPLPALFYLENQSLKGRFEAELDLSGPWNSPEIDGVMRIEKGMYEHTEYGLLLRDVQASARMTGRRIVIEKAAATDGEGGRITVEGGLTLDAEKNFPHHLKVRMEKSTLVRRQDLTVACNGELNLSGDFRNQSLAGRLTVGPAEYTLPRKLPVDIPELDVKEINRPHEKKGGKKDKVPGEDTSLKLDIALDSPGQIFIRGHGVSSEWKGDLRVSGSAGRPVVKGQLSVVRGRYTFYEKQFELAEGVIQFSGAVPPYPHLNITAVHQRQDLTVRILVSGTPDSLNVELNSEPALPKDEIFSRLLFGRSVADITPMQALRLANAVRSLLAGGDSITDFVENTRRLIGVDELSISPDDEGQTSVRVGKYLGEDIFLQLEKGFGAEEEGSVSVEVRITPNLSLESEAGATGQGGAILNWRWDY